MTNPETDRLHAVLTVTVASRPDGGHYFDQADFAAHVIGWVRAALKGKHAVAELTVVEAPAAVSVPPPAPQAADRAAVLAEVADWLKAWRPEFFERWAIAEQERYEGGIVDAAAELRRLAAEARRCPRCGEDLATYAEDDLVWRTGDDRPYCSGECVIAAHRAAEAPTTTKPETEPDDEALRAKVDEATATLRRIRSTIRTLKDQGATGRAYYQAIADDLAGPRPDRYEAGDEQQPVGPCVAGEQQNETPEAEAPVVAYRSRDSRSLYCTAHAGELFGLSYEPVTAEDLPDGGICTYPDCGRDVLAGPRP